MYLAVQDGKILFQRLLPPHRPKASPDDRETPFSSVSRFYATYRDIPQK